MTREEALKILENAIDLSVFEDEYIYDLLDIIEQEDFLKLNYDKKNIY